MEDSFVKADWRDWLTVAMYIGFAAFIAWRVVLTRPKQ